MKHILHAFAALMFCVSAGHAQDALIGTATIVDGDTIEIHGQRIRLFGIDTPEKAQTCDDADGQPYRCGQKASFALADFIARSPVSCEQKAIDRYGRIVGRCFVRNLDINEFMVRSGWAMAYRRYADPPPMNWSTLMYVFGQEKEDGYAQEKTDAGRNCRKATTGRYSCFTGEKRG